MELQFEKMHGAGNDFMIVEWPKDLDRPDESTVRRWADRRMGVGFDQLLLLYPPDKLGFSAFFRMFNADGSEAQQRGNGVRCIARYLEQRGVGGDTLILSRLTGTVEARLEVGGEVSVNLGEPDYAPTALPFLAHLTTHVGGDSDASQATRYRLDIDAGPVEFGAVSVGNPHAVIPVDSADAAPVGIIGPQLQAHQSFPDGVNVGFVEFRDAENIRLRVFERGAGETAACGTGAAAAVAIGRLWGELGETVRVEVKGGVLNAVWPGPGHAIWLSGPVGQMSKGRIEI